MIFLSAMSLRRTSKDWKFFLLPSTLRQNLDKNQKKNSQKSSQKNPPKKKSSLKDPPEKISPKNSARAYVTFLKTGWWNSNVQTFWTCSQSHIIEILLCKSFYAPLRAIFLEITSLYKVAKTTTDFYFSWFNVWIMSFGRWMLTLVLNVEYMFLFPGTSFTIWGTFRILKLSLSS